MSKNAFFELQKASKQFWELENTYSKFLKQYGKQKAMIELNKSRQTFLQGQQQRKSEYEQAYGLACGKRKIISEQSADERKIMRRGERLANRILQTTILRASKNIPTKK